jgi:ech hydrogenase subunit C
MINGIVKAVELLQKRSDEHDAYERTHRHGAEEDSHDA